MKKLIKYPFQKIYKFFLWSSGADLEILKQAPTDNSKYFGIGGTIVFTALMASFAGGYAFFTAFKSSILSIFFGLFWGALIFNLDRYIVSTFGVGDGKKTISKQELLEAAPRLAMAVILGFVISTPLELKLFESEINAEIDKQIAISNQKLENENSPTSNDILVNYRSQVEALKGSVSNREETLKNKRKEYEQADEDQRMEWNGQGKTGKRGKGPYWEELNQKAQRLLVQLENMESNYSRLNEQDRAKITELQNKIRIYEDGIISDIESHKRVQEQNNGLMARLLALNRLCFEETEQYEIVDGTKQLTGVTTSRSIVWYTKWLVTILFIFIEIAPILFKMMTERGTYDDILDRIKHEAKVKQLLLQSNINQEINTAVKVNTEKNEQKLNSELLANKELLESISKAQAQIAQVAIEEWKKEQIKKVKASPSTMIKS
ncbi:DUF4407 domain-containing protein [Corallibacter sp.]|uniref:DUF4407 domain-containing protein n=1 Tax=Corallibacter sp. TaxID=2038084 RepID=UPI003AB2DA80